MEKKSRVYFTKTITPEKVIEMYKAMGINLKGKVATKVHSGEDGNQNYLHPEFWKPIIEYVNGTVVETNTAYEGERNSTEKHKKLIEKHNWTKFFNVDIMDEEGEDLCLDIPSGKILKKNYVGKNMKNYDSMLVLAHFKGHPCAGYGGALKQLSIGCASSKGKCLIHSANYTNDQTIVWQHMASNEDFCQCMADSASSVVNFFKGKIAFINIMCNLSVDCDCCAVAEDPCMHDIGILSSLDPVALDKACMDLIYSSEDKGKEHFIERVERQNGTYTIKAAEEINIGTTDYELIEIK